MYSSANMYGKEEHDGHMAIQMQPSGGGGGGYVPMQYPQMATYHQPQSTPYIMGIDYSQPPAQPFDRFPLVCSVIAMLCCPMTCICSLPAFICSMCGYSDYRVHDIQEFRRKTDCSRRLVITACVFALLIWIGTAIFAYYFQERLLNWATKIRSNFQ